MCFKNFPILSVYTNMKIIGKESTMLLRRVISSKFNSFSEFSVRSPPFTHQMLEVKENPSCEYPLIVDMSDEGQKRHFRQLWYDSVKNLPTVEQKLFELAVQQKLDLKTYTMTSVAPTYNGVSFQNYITRTHFIDNLPKLFAEINVDSELEEIRETLCETLLNCYCNVWMQSKSKTLHDYLLEPNAGSKLVNSLISQCFKKLAVRNDYVINSTIQQKPRIHSFWWHGGFGKEKDEVDEKNLCFQYEDYGAFCIRGKLPLLPILNMDDNLCSTPEVIDYHFPPEVFHTPSSVKSKVSSIPGYWPGDPHEYPFLLVLNSDRFQSLASELEFYDRNKIENGSAIISSFAWLNAVATYQGFTPFHDITYPLVTQTIVTNGQDWNFFIYQLNTIAFHNDVDKKDRRNLCWSSGKLRLFDAIEDGQIKGINEEVFRVLLKFLHNVPQERHDIDMKPYLGTDARDTNDIVYTRYLLRKMNSRRPGHLDHKDEIPTWVKIYKLHPDAPPSPFVRLE